MSDHTFFIMKTMIGYTPILDLIHAKNSFLITTHINPDCDAIGSELALAAFLSSLNKRVTIVNQDPTPRNAQFLDPQRHILTTSQYSTDKHGMAEVVIFLDLNRFERIGTVAEILPKVNPPLKVCIDHHEEPADVFDIALIDPSAPATGYLIFGLLQSYGCNTITKDIAEALYAAILTDTGSFRFPSVTKETHQIIGELIGKGANPSLIYQNIYEMSTILRLQLLGKVLSRFQLDSTRKISYSYISKDMFIETETTEQDAENFVNFGLQVMDSSIALLFVELDGSIKINFRTRGSVPANALAQNYGGNGHRNAAGARVPGAELFPLIQKVIIETQHFINSIHH